MFKELGIPLTHAQLIDPDLFAFIHQSHKNTQENKFSTKEYESGSVFKIVEIFNDVTRKEFMSDPLAAKMFYFVYKNFMDQHIVHVISNYKKEVATCICMALRCYQKITDESELNRLHYLIK